MTRNEKTALLVAIGGLLALVIFKAKPIYEAVTGKFTITPARRAMLKMINWAEGSPGYDQLFSYVPFNNNGPHPNIKIPFGTTYSSAAGAYQFLYNTWQEVIKKLGIADLMSVENQDQAALQKIQDRGALNDVDTGNISSAINKLSWEWASLPPARYGGQSARSLSELLTKYNEFLKSSSNG